MTEAEIQQYVHSIYEGDTLTPSESDEDYLVRRDYINLGINAWENARNVSWIELFKYLSDNGTTNVATGVTSITLPADYVKPLGYLVLTDADGKKTELRYTDLFNAQESSTGKYWRVGNTLRFDELTVDTTAELPYYSKATKITSASQTPPCSDSLFLVHYTLHWLYKEEDAGKSREQFDIANEYLANMKRLNDMEVAKQNIQNSYATPIAFGR